MAGAGLVEQPQDAGPPFTWTDVYGAVHALWRGLPGGHRWLLACPPPHAAEVARALPGHFKGEVQLLVTEHLTPLEAAARDFAPRGVLVVDRDLSGGPALTLPTRQIQAEGLSYREGGPLPAWHSAVPGEAAQDEWPQGECAPASAVAALGLPVVVCSPARVTGRLLAWWRQTPHAALPGAQLEAAWR